MGGFNYDYYNELRRVQQNARICKSNLSLNREGTRPILEYIKLTFTGNTAQSPEALDGLKAGYIMLSLTDSEETVKCYYL